MAESSVRHFILFCFDSSKKKIFHRAFFSSFVHNFRTEDGVIGLVPNTILEVEDIPPPVVPSPKETSNPYNNFFIEILISEVAPCQESISPDRDDQPPEYEHLEHYSKQS